MNGKGLVLILVAWISVLLYSQHPKRYYNDVKAKLERMNVYMPEKHIEVVQFVGLRKLLYGYNGTMGAYASHYVTAIAINSNEWYQLTTHQKKLLVFHEILHSTFGYENEIRHCYKQTCVMSTPGRISKFDGMTFDELVKNTLTHHNIAWSEERTPSWDNTKKEVKQKYKEFIRYIISKLIQYEKEL